MWSQHYLMHKEIKISIPTYRITYKMYIVTGVKQGIIKVSLMDNNCNSMTISRKRS